MIQSRRCRACGVPIDPWRHLCPDHGYVPDGADYVERLEELVAEFPSLARWVKEGESGWEDLFITEADDGVMFSEGTQRLVEDLVRVWDEGGKKRSGPKPVVSPKERLHRMKLLFWQALGIDERPVGEVWRALDVDSGRQIAAGRDREKVVSIAREWGEDRPDKDWQLLAA